MLVFLLRKLFGATAIGRSLIAETKNSDRKIAETKGICYFVPITTDKCETPSLGPTASISCRMVTIHPGYHAPHEFMMVLLPHTAPMPAGCHMYTYPTITMILFNNWQLPIMHYKMIVHAWLWHTDQPLHRPMTSK